MPGIGVKRWLALVLVGELALALAGAFVLKQIYRDIILPGPLEGVVYVLTLQFLPYGARALPLLVAGIAVFLVAVVKLVHTLLLPFGDPSGPLVEVIYQKRYLARGPRVVAIGGGTGLSALLRGLKEHTSNITAVVTVADDGGSSGKLRTELGIAPMGDIRNCIAALADAEPLMTRLLQYRFPDDHPPSPGVGGHSFGNLLIAAMSAIEGDFEEGVRQSNRVLAVRGQVVPAAPVPLTLHARLVDGREIHGQSVIARATGIERVWVTPSGVRATREVVDAIAEADCIVLGPGSLYTSLLPSLLIPEVRDAVATSRALRCYVCNVATQVGETEGYGLAAHIAALEAHAGASLVDVVLVNDNFLASRPEGDLSEAVRLDWVPPRAGPEVVRRAVVDLGNAHRHDSALLAAALLSIYQDHARSRPSLRVANTA
ncbi:MAG TPA: gluconeogenesis factor YvcK family protein [Candidatus Acidoferrales bacterium]|nr:gluconeogenesis factor YvcK family protein [Candidatus Acidoferrales bacterium]